MHCLCFLIYIYVYVFSCMHIGMYVYVLYLFLNLIMSIIPTLYFFVEFVILIKVFLTKIKIGLPPLAREWADNRQQHRCMFFSEFTSVSFSLEWSSGLKSVYSLNDVGNLTRLATPTCPKCLMVTPRIDPLSYVKAQSWTCIFIYNYYLYQLWITVLDGIW